MVQWVIEYFEVYKNYVIYTLWSLWSLHLSPVKHLRDFELIKHCSLPQISNHQVGE